MFDNLLSDNRKSLKEFSQIINMFPNFISIKNKKFYYTAVNSTVANILGCKSPEIVMEKNINDTHIQAPAALLAEDFYEEDHLVITENKRIKVFCFAYYADNKNHAFFGEKFPIKNKKNEIVGIGCTSMDVSSSNMINFGLMLAKQNSRYSAKFNKKQFTFILKENQPNIQLTSRQKECLFYIIRGRSTKSIAAELNLSPRTVEKHVDIIKTKFKCYSKNALIEKAIHLGFLNMIPERLLSTHINFNIKSFMSL